MANKPLQSLTFPGLPDTYTVPQLDTTLTQAGSIADAKKVGDELTNLKDDLNKTNNTVDEVIHSKFNISGEYRRSDGNYATYTKDLKPGCTYELIFGKTTWNHPQKDDGVSLCYIGAASYNTESESDGQYNYTALYSVLYPETTVDKKVSITIPYDTDFVLIGVRVDENESFSIYYRETNSNNKSNTSWISGKKISIIGDSIDTFDKDGYKIDGYRMHYPTQYLTDLNQTWWMKVISASDAQLEVNASWAGSRVTGTVSGYPDFYDRTPISIIGNPDVILVTLGTNDSSNNVPLGDYDFDTTYTELSESTFRTAYIKGVKALKVIHPNAEIICISEKMTDDYKNSIIYIAERLSVKFIDVSNYDGVAVNNVHPAERGMRQIASHVLFPTDKTLLFNDIPADSKIVGDLINGKIWNEYAKSALLDCLSNVAWINNKGRELCMALRGALGMQEISYLTATFNSNGEFIYTDTPLENLKQYLSVTAHFTNGEQFIIENYNISGTLSEGNSTITITYVDVSVTVTISNVIDFYNTFVWRYGTNSFNNLRLLKKGMFDKQVDGRSRGVFTTEAEATAGRRGFYTERGLAPALTETNFTKTKFYPIPVPATATKATVTLSSDTQRLYIYMFKYINDDTLQTYNYNRYIEATGWVGTPTVITFTASSDLFIAFNCKEQTGNIVTEPVFTLTFE